MRRQERERKVSVHFFQGQCSHSHEVERILFWRYMCGRRAVVSYLSCCACSLLSLLSASRRLHSATIRSWSSRVWKNTGGDSGRHRTTGFVAPPVVRHVPRHRTVGLTDECTTCGEHGFNCSWSSRLNITNTGSIARPTF